MSTRRQRNRLTWCCLPWEAVVDFIEMNQKYCLATSKTDMDGFFSQKKYLFNKKRVQPTTYILNGHKKYRT